MKRLLFLLFLLLPVLGRAQIISTIAGTPGSNGFYGDGGMATDAWLDFPDGVVVDSLGNIYIADFWNARIRVINTDGTIHTFAGNGSYGRTGDGGPATAAGLQFPESITLDGLGNMYIVCDSVTQPLTRYCTIGYANIRKIDSRGIITSVAGTGLTGYNGDNIPATAAGLEWATGIAADKKGNIYLSEPVDRIRKIDTAGIITTIAGNGTRGFGGDGGPATAALIFNESGGGLAVDPWGNLVFGDVVNHVVRRIDTTGIITTIAGDTAGGYAGDGGPATSARLCSPYGIAIDSTGNIFTADFCNFAIREISNTDIITSVAGKGVSGYTGDGGPADSAKMEYVTDIALDKAGNLYLADKEAITIRMMCNQCAGTGVPAVPKHSLQIEVAPNPATTQLSITSAALITTVAITNMMGQTVYSQECNTMNVQVDVAALPAGMYFVKVNGTEVRRFVKE